MAKSTHEAAKPRKKRPKQTGQMISTRLQPALLKRLDDWRRKQPDLPSRPEALRRLADKGLESWDDFFDEPGTDLGERKQPKP